MTSDAIDVQGGLLTRDFLQRLRAGDVPGGKAADYDVAGRLEDRVTASWNELRNAWGIFQVQRARVPKDDDDEAYRVTRDSWIKFVFDVLRFGHVVEEKRPLRIEDKDYPIRFVIQGVPVHVVAFTQELDIGPSGTARGNPHSLLQEYLNRKQSDSWGILTNGREWRILRNNAASTRASYISFNLEAVMERFDEFSLWWRVAHASRVLPRADEAPWLEKWMLEADRLGTRALDDLRKGVEEAIKTLGAGFLKHPRNAALYRRLESKELSGQEYYHQILRLVYRLIFLFVTEDRGLLLDPKASRESKDVYTTYYGTQRLRKLALEIRGSQHHDLFEGLKVVMDGLKNPRGAPAIGIVGLNGALWSKEFIPDLDTASIRNTHFLQAIRNLTRIKRDDGQYQVVDYQRMASEELGSIYESLMEFEATVIPQERLFNLNFTKGSERRTTGSHYTPTELIDKVLDHALDPLLDEAQDKTKHPTPQEREKALLELTVCDPTCGSGHFLIAAAHRIAHRVAQERTGEFEPGVHDKRHALRDVVGRCIYGVDINPMAVELCKVGLWLEAMEPGKPLTFLDHHIKCGNALLGAFPEYLEKGIPDEAYTPRPGIDNPEVCKELKRINKNFPMQQTKLVNFKEDSERVQSILAKCLEHIDAMPSDTVEQIAAKEEAYRTMYLGTNEYERYKLALDAWCAAFSYPKVGLGNDANIGNPDLVDLLHPEGPAGVALNHAIQAEVMRRENRFFHWFVEFPAIAKAGGFALLVGNPPYLGGSKVSGTLGHHYNAYLVTRFDGYRTGGDLAGAFVLSFWRLRRLGGAIGMITTNTLGKGATRENGLALIRRKGAVVAFAQTDIEWPGVAAVVVCAIVLRDVVATCLLNGRAVASISSRLDSLPENEVATLPMRQNKCFEGDKAGGKGFVVSDAEAKAWIAADQSYAEIVKPYLTADDLLQGTTQGPSRWIICFRDWPLDQARRYEAAFKRVEALVKPERANNNEARTRENWWQFKRFTKAMRLHVGSQKTVLVRAGVSETPLFCQVSADSVFSNALFVIAASDWNTCGQLNSAIHETWYRRQGSGMKQDSRYTPSTCFETFPVPRETLDIARLGEAFHEAVLAHARQRGMALTPLWNLVNDPECKDADIEEIRSLRNQLTVAVANAFGMTGIDFGFGFYKDHADRWRYKMSPEADENVYLELVRLNAEQAAAEKAVAGNGADSAGPKTKKAQIDAKAAKGQQKLDWQQPVRL